MHKSPAFSQEKYLKAFHFAARAHEGQNYSGTSLPYIMHITFVCMEVIAALGIEQVDDADLAVQAAILHDVIEDKHVSRKKLAEEFGESVASGIQQLTKDENISEPEIQFAEYMDRLSNAPREIKMVKLADRISNLQKPPFQWDQQKIADYREKSIIILNTLGDASPYLAKRLKHKIDNYAAYQK